MGDNNFRLPPVSPLIGGKLKTFDKLMYGKYVDPKYRFKIFLSRLVVQILSPLRYYEEKRFSKIQVSEPVLKPLFILGHWRSGTTYLHNILCQDPENAFVTTYQTVFANYLNSQGFLKPIMKWVMPSRRPADNVELAADYPQEEEFALSNTSELSFYNFFYFPRHTGDYYHKYVRFENVNGDREQFVADYDKILRRALLNRAPASRLVVKNPVNTARLPLLTSTYPQADFIHIHRNPYEVYLSTKRFFTELFPTLWFQHIEQKQINELILDLYLNLYDDYFSYLDTHPEFKLMEIEYESFQSDPNPYIKRVYDDYFEQDFEKVKSKFDAYILSQKSHQITKHSISEEEYETVTDRWAKYINHWNYPFPDNLSISK